MNCQLVPAVEGLANYGPSRSRRIIQRVTVTGIRSFAQAKTERYERPINSVAVANRTGQARSWVAAFRVPSSRTKDCSDDIFDVRERRIIASYCIRDNQMLIASFIL